MCPRLSLNGDGTGWSTRVSPLRSRSRSFCCVSITWNTSSMPLDLIWLMHLLLPEDYAEKPTFVMIRLAITKWSGNWDSSVGVAIIVKTENRAELTVTSKAGKTDDLRAIKLLLPCGPFSNILSHPQYVVFLTGRSYRYILLKCSAEGNEISKVL